MGDCHYKLDDKGEPTPCNDLCEWAEWFGSEAGSAESKTGRQVKYEEVHKGVHVSTVFLGLDHSFQRGVAPVLWETMVFVDESSPLDGADFDNDQCRCSGSREQAMAMHQRMVRNLKPKILLADLLLAKLNGLEGKVRNG